MIKLLSSLPAQSGAPWRRPLSQRTTSARAHHPTDRHWAVASMRAERRAERHRVVDTIPAAIPRCGERGGRHRAVEACAASDCEHGVVDEAGRLIDGPLVVRLGEGAIHPDERGVRHADPKGILGVVATRRDARAPATATSVIRNTPSAIRHQLSAISHQPIGHRASAISPSAIGHQPINHRPSAHQPLVISPSTIGHQPISHRSSVISDSCSGYHTETPEPQQRAHARARQSAAGVW